MEEVHSSFSFPYNRIDSPSAGFFRAQIGAELKLKEKLEPDQLLLE